MIQHTSIILPTLTRDSLILHPRTLDNLLKCREMDKDPEVTQYIPGVWDGSEKHIAFLREKIRKSYPSRLGYWPVFSKDEPTHFPGWVHLLPLPDNKHTTGVSCRLRRLAWSRGYATEAAQIVLKHAFQSG